jgi:nitrite reductase/ring-hydroxylating ferredoxin subunit
MEFVEATELKNLPPNSHMVVSIRGKDVLLFNSDDEISAIGNLCLHKGGPLGEGKVENKYDGRYVTCPWHGWEYNVKTGSAAPGFADQQAVYDVMVKQGKIFVSTKPKVLPVKAKHKDNPLRDLEELQYETSPTSLNILGIS